MQWAQEAPCRGAQSYRDQEGASWYCAELDQYELNNRHRPKSKVNHSGNRSLFWVAEEVAGAIRAVVGMCVEKWNDFELSNCWKQFVHDADE